MRGMMAMLAFAWALAACAATPIRLPVLDEVEGVRSEPVTAEEAKIVPEAYAHAAQERDFALAAHAAGDDVAATLHAERALAAYAHARIVARRARATTELAEAQKALSDATTEEQELEGSRAALDREAEELQQRIRAARERVLPASSAPATPEREAARGVAARSLAMQARLLCGAAHMIARDASGLADADRDVTSLQERLAKSPRPAPIDDASRSRAHCLDALTRARRNAGLDAEAADALLSELSAAASWDPARDERGVVVTLHDAFQGPALTTGATEKLKSLGRVAAAHHLFGVQVVIHDARAPAPNDTTDAKRADAAVQAVVGGGAAASGVRAELAGAFAPIVDPSDERARGRNERIEVVFVL